MGYLRTFPIESGVLRIFFTDRADGDFQVRDPAADVELRRRQIVDAPWTWVHQVHGTNVVVVEQPGQHAGVKADGLVTTAAGCPIAVTTADCSPVVLVADRGVAVLHVGWRGLYDGIVERGGTMLRERAGEPVEALVGPCIHPEAYEFGEDELELMADRYGDHVRSSTSWGTTALDLPEAVERACERAGWTVSEIGPCTTDLSYYSHRTRTEGERLTTVAWIEVP